MSGGFQMLSAPADEEDGNEAGEELGEQGFQWSELWKFMGPGWMVSIAYLDPGNLETDLQGGAEFSYSLCWVLLWSSILGIVIQILSLRLGIVTRTHLATMCKEEYDPWLRYLLWSLSELMIVASDVPEVIGTAFAVQILSNGKIPLWGGVVLCSLSTLIFLSLSSLGMSYLNAFIAGLVSIMSVCFIMECGLNPPNAGQTLLHTFVPSFPDGSVGISIGLLGAVCMPHNLYLQSALVLSRKVARNKRSVSWACFYNSVETTVALMVSFFINASVMLVAAASFAPFWVAAERQVCNFDTGDADTGGEEVCFSVGLETAGLLLRRIIGTKARVLWAVALLASGQSSTITGTFAGQFVMQGFLDLSLPIWFRNFLSRSLAIVPSLVVSIVAGAKGANDLVVLSSVVLAIHLPLALVPLLKFTDSAMKMGNQRNSWAMSIGCWFLSMVVVAANSVLVWEVVKPMLDPNIHSGGPWKLTMVLVCSVAYLVLLGYLIYLPVRRKTSLPPDVVDDESPSIQDPLVPAEMDTTV
mmetsp:Transcript_10635/g.16667  ORF Transcript_10635/g.16667 Transcript_10635/m.16667 type:complete len:527 (+) Transcript_10635:534-2114(+)